MEKNIINTGTITYALRGRDSLRKHGYKAYMFRTTGDAAVGCGYAVSEVCPRAIIEKIFQSEGIKYISITSGDGL